MAPEAPRVATRASRAPRSPRGLLAVPWWSLTVLAILVVAATRAAADAEVYQEYARSARDEAAPAAAAPKWPEPDSEDEFVDRISMLMGPSKEGGRDLAAQRLRLSRLREEQEEKERQQQKQQQQQKDSLQKQLQGERASHESPQQQQQQQVRPRPAQETKASAKAPQQQQRPADDTERQMQLYWQEAARAALAKQQKEAVSKATLARQQEAETKAAQEAAKARQAEAAKAALSKQQEVAAQQEEAKALYAKQQQEEARQAAAAAKAKQEEAVAAAKDEQQLEDLDDAYDIARALTQQPSVPAIDQTLLRTYMRSLGPQVGSVDQVGPIWQRYWDQVLASLSQQGLQQQQQPAVSDLIAELLNDAERQTQQTQQRQREMQWQAQQQQQTQDRQQQMLLQAQHEQMDPSTAQKMLLQQQQTQQQPQQQQQPPFTYTFQKPEQSSRFAINPADPRFWQEDPRLQYLVSRSGGVDGSQPQEDQYDEGSSGVRQALIRSASGLSIPMDLGVSSEQQPDQPDDMVDVDEDLGAVGDDMWLPQQRQQQQRQQQGARVTPPVVPEGIRHQPKPTATRDSRLDDESGRGSNLSNHDYPVVKKQLTFPKDHWFFGMDDVGKLAIFIGASIAVSSMILGFIVWQYRLHRNAKAAADVEYPAYGVTGPNKDVSPTGDRRLAQSAQMYHYQHQKQQILAMESRAAGGRRGSMSEAESEDENEEGDYTVYECPGLAPTQEMEVKNPLFQDDPTPATPAPGVGAEAGHDGDGLPEGGKQQQQQAGKTKQDKHSNNGKTTRSKPSDKSDRP